MIKLLQKKYNFLSDDSIFANNKEIFPTNYFLSVRKDFPNHPDIKKIVENHIEEKIFINIEKDISSILLSNSINISQNNFYIIKPKEKTWGGIRKMIEPFPCIAHHSFWCTKFLTNALDRSIDIDKWISNKLDMSITFWENQTRNAEEIILDFSNFEYEIEKYDRQFSRLAI